MAGPVAVDEQIGRTPRGIHPRPADHPRHAPPAEEALVEVEGAGVRRRSLDTRGEGVGLGGQREDDAGVATFGKVRHRITPAGQKSKARRAPKPWITPLPSEDGTGTGPDGPSAQGVLR